VIQFKKMADFVRHYIVAQMIRQKNETIIEREVATGRTAPKPRALVAYGK
jgi:hypothetical protein